MTDFDLFLKETGITHQDMEAAKCYTQVTKLWSASAAKLEVSESQIEGLGLMARTDLVPGESFKAMTGWQWTETGRFANHSATPSAMVIAVGHDLEFVVVKPLKTGEELTVDYRQVKSLCLNSG